MFLYEIAEQKLNYLNYSKNSKFIMEYKFK